MLETRLMELEKMVEANREAVNRSAREVSSDEISEDNERVRRREPLPGKVEDTKQAIYVVRPHTNTQSPLPTRRSSAP